MDPEDLNRQAIAWCKVVKAKPHGTTGEVPVQQLTQEGLLSLPPQETRDCYHWETRVVIRDGLVSFDGVRYGVPWQYSGKEVLIRTMNGQLEIYYGDILLVKHQLQYRTGRIVWLPGQYRGLTERKGIAAAYSAAQQQQLRVEVRSLNFYDSFLEGGGSHG